jgi:acyl dehydratase
VNSYTFDEINVGHEVQFTDRLTDEDMLMFCRITGDENPLHTDTDYAVSRGYKGRIAYGMLTASYLSTVAGMYLPGKNSLIHEVTVKFVSPVVFEEKSKSDAGELKIIAKVTEKHDVFKRLVIKVHITDANDICVLRANMKVGVLE